MKLEFTLRKRGYPVQFSDAKKIVTMFVTPSEELIESFDEWVIVGVEVYEP